VVCLDLGKFPGRKITSLWRAWIEVHIQQKVGCLHRVLPVSEHVMHGRVYTAPERNDISIVSRLQSWSVIYIFAVSDHWLLTNMSWM
jgi:hypothetical protein